MIWEKIDKELIKNEIWAIDQDDALEKMGSFMTMKGCGKPGYAKELIKREAENPTGIDMSGFGIAIPHTDASHVAKDGIGIGILSNPIKFTQMGTDDEFVDVKLLFVLAITNPKAHLDQIQALLSALQDRKVLESIWSSDSPEEIVDIIRKKETGL